MPAMPIIINVNVIITGHLSNQGEKSINFYFIMVPLRKSIKVWYSKAQNNIAISISISSSINIINNNIVAIVIAMITTVVAL